VLQIPHLPQTNPQSYNSCVPAAVRMVLAFHGVILGEEELCRLLETQPVGTSVLNVLLLTQHVSECHVEVISASFDDLVRWLQENVPPIVFVSTAPLHYWQAKCLHALVVVGIEEQSVWVHDPALATAPTAIPRDEFLAAWGEVAQLAALVKISPSQPS
jgi:ABC-type bacteriocin/lantibiotic exporter with double-glycine peptidase domain